MNLRTTFATLGAVAIVIGAPNVANADRLGTAIKEIGTSTRLIEDVTANPNNRIPASLLRDSQGIVILTNVAQGGLIVGGRGGDGVLLVRQPDGAWGNPAFVKTGGGNIGFQAGFKKGDIILLLMTRSAVNRILTGAVEFGGNVSGVAGPIGATPVDPNKVKGEILTYSFVDGGLYGGVTLEGGTFGFEDKVNEDFYDVENITPEEVLFNPEFIVPTGDREIFNLHQALQAAES
ncbi:MAG: lipid-binding SYLF domain-containing protein [Cyanobacteria bacterium J06641_5]